MALIEVNNLKVYFPIRTGIFGRIQGHVRAVDNVSFKIRRGETLGLVGESGSGKTTVERSVLGAIDPTDGQVFLTLDGRKVELSKLEGKELRKFRKHLQMIFQDPYASLNPRMTVRDIIAEPLDVSIQAEILNLLVDLRKGAMQGRSA